MNGLIVFYACLGLPVAALVAFLLWSDRATRTKNLDGLQMEERARQQARFDKLSPARRLYTPPGELDRRRR
ncbi:hypothetical protein ACIBTP_35975 [Streptomyces avidinii]|uniref:Iron-regulated membrane protein n=1 Tax=Streptomyces avidinii TaxID=1895 RepID=A0ABS4L6J5_STRAV|nr:hypothetical protein [Streptomyces avidinii]MBP2037712.1 putative iron-regulated membrane protein [Streptomyces avidinii]GGZ09239.1 hypothetical protein GCM10010343_39520 [Streptomyces avidinii]